MGAAPAHGGRSTFEVPMAVNIHLENYYAFRQHKQVEDLARAPKSATRAELSQIEAALVSANKLFIARKYQTAIAAYQYAERLLHAHLNPSAPVWVPRG